MRCFIALRLPEDAHRILARTAAACREALEIAGLGPRTSWTRPEGYHLTLAFLGELGGPAIDAAASALGAVSGFGPIDCRFTGLGGFPAGGGGRNRGSSARLWRVLFAGIDEGGKCSILHRALNEALVEAARRAGLPPLNPEWPQGGSAGGKPFTAHITLARARPGSGIPAEAALGAGAMPPEAWTIGRCALYKSELRSSGSVYTELRGVDL